MSFYSDVMSTDAHVEQQIKTYKHKQHLISFNKKKNIWLIIVLENLVTMTTNLNNMSSEYHYLLMWFTKYKIKINVI